MGTSFPIVACEQAPRWSQVKIKSMSKASWVWPEGEKRAEKPEAFVLMPPQPYQILVSWFDLLDHWLSCNARCPQAPPWAATKETTKLPDHGNFPAQVFSPPFLWEVCLSHFLRSTYPQLSRQNQKPHGKNKIPHGKTKTSWQKQNTSWQNRNLTAKTKTSQRKLNTSRQNQRPHGKTKYFTAKTKYLTAKANTHGKTKAILFLLWSIWFCREVFGFAVTFLVLPWGILFCHEVFGFAVTVVGHHIHQSICYQIFEWKWNFKKHITYESSPFPIK